MTVQAGLTFTVELPDESVFCMAGTGSSSSMTLECWCTGAHTHPTFFSRHSSMPHSCTNSSCHKKGISFSTVKLWVFLLYCIQCKKTCNFYMKQWSWGHELSLACQSDKSKTFYSPVRYCSHWNRHTCAASDWLRHVSRWSSVRGSSVGLSASIALCEWDAGFVFQHHYYSWLRLC